LDVGAHSQSVKIAGREPVRLNPGDAAARGLHDGDLVRIFNDRGACLAGLAVDEAVRPGVAQLSTGAWYDPDPAVPGFCRHGNPFGCGARRDILRSASASSRREQPNTDSATAAALKSLTDTFWSARWNSPPAWPAAEVMHRAVQAGVMLSQPRSATIVTAGTPIANRRGGGSKPYAHGAGRVPAGRPDG